jgi:2-phosphosulfolactate phosphatase
LDWGRGGARRAAARGDLLVVVDVLCFSTSVATAVARGGVIYPCAVDDEPSALAARVGAETAVRRPDVSDRSRFSLSPPTFEQIAAPDTRIVLASPNGATCSRYGNSVPALFAGALVNARAVAEAVADTLCANPTVGVTMLACGERWTVLGR